jgi:hypothetical protein
MPNVIYLKQSTAVTLKIGPFLDDADGKTAETGLAIAQADVRLSKNGANIAQKNEATSCTHDELGIYGCPINATDTGTLGRLQLWVHESGALPVWHDFMIVTANVYDSLFSTDKLEVDLLQMVGVAQSATDLKDFADTGYDPSGHKTQAQIKGTDDIDLSATQKTSVNTEVDTALSDIKLDHLIAVADADDPVNDSIIAKIAASDGDWSGFDKASDALEAIRDRGDAAWITGGGGGITDIINAVPSIPTNIDIANTKTIRLALYIINSLDDLPSTAEITPGTITIERSGDGGTSWTAIVNAAACTEQAGQIYYDEVFDSGSGYASGDMVRITFKGQKITVSANDYEITGAGNGWIFHTRIDGGVAGDSAAAVANAVWDEAIADHVVGTSFGAKNQKVVPSETIGDYKADIAALALEATLTAMKGSGYLEATDSLEAIRNRGDLSWITGTGSAADIADAVWDELQSGHVDAGSFGKYLDTEVSGVGGIGSGALTCTWTQNDDQGSPIDNCKIWITTDEAGNNVVAGTLHTNANGEAVFHIDAGTYYVFREHAGYNFTNPQTWVVS